MGCPTYLQLLRRFHQSKFPIRGIAACECRGCIVNASCLAHTVSSPKIKSVDLQLLEAQRTVSDSQMIWKALLPSITEKTNKQKNNHKAHIQVPQKLILKNLKCGNHLSALLLELANHRNAHAISLTGAILTFSRRVEIQSTTTLTSTIEVATCMSGPPHPIL